MTDPTPMHDLLAALDRAVAGLDLLRRSKAAKETLAALIEHYPDALAQVSRRRALEASYYAARDPVDDRVPYALDLPEFLACCDAMGVTDRGLDVKYDRPDRQGNRWCVMSLDGTMKLGPVCP